MERPDRGSATNIREGETIDAITKLDETRQLRRRMIEIATPIVIGNMLQQLYNTMDTVIIGKYLGSDAFSAAGIGGTVMNLFIFVLTGCCTGASVILSQMYGRKDFNAYRREASTALGCGLIFSGILAIGGLLLVRPLLRAMNTPDTLLPYTMDYLRVILLVLPITLLYNLFAAYLRRSEERRVGNECRSRW